MAKAWDSENVTCSEGPDPEQIVGQKVPLSSLGFQFWLFSLWVPGFRPWSLYPVSSITRGKEEGATLTAGLYAAGSGEHLRILQAIIWLLSVQEYKQTAWNHTLDTIFVRFWQNLSICTT